MENTSNMRRSSSPPTHISAESVRVYNDTPDGGLRVGVAVDEILTASGLRFGLKWMRPGTAAVSWEPSADTHEAYFVHAGELRVSWTGSDAGEVIVSAGECFYLPPARSYTIENAGQEDVFGVWASCLDSLGSGQ